MQKSLLLSFILLVTSWPAAEQATAQKMEYEIHWLGKVGKLSIQKLSRNDSLYIETNSEVKIPFYKFNWITNTTSANGVLCRSKYSQLLNEKSRESREIRRLSYNKWKATDQDGKTELIDFIHTFYVSMLYFVEPVSETQIFSERFGKPLQLINEGNGLYRLMLPDNNYCDYYYENGICKVVKAKNGSRTIKMILAENTGS